MRNYLEFFNRVDGEVNVVERHEIIESNFKGEKCLWQVINTPAGTPHITFTTNNGEVLGRPLGGRHWRLCIENINGN